MNKKVMVLAGLLALLAAGSALFLLRKPEKPDHPVARITLDGELVEEIDLAALEGRKTLTLEGKSGLTNTVVAENGQIWVEEADCPDQICVNKGKISTSAVPIICLPNQMIIEIVGGVSDVDTATG